VAATYDKKAQMVRLVAHKVFVPTPIDFESTIEATILEWREKFQLRKVYFDPFQMVSVAQRLQRAGVKVEEFPQTVPNLTAATSNLFDLIQSRSLVLYPDAPMRLAISRAVMHESSRGWRLDKLKQAHKIDVVVALSLAAFAAVRGQGESSYISDLSWVNGPYEADADAEAAARAFQEARFNAHVLAHSGYYLQRRWR
jgi:phage terminase large subunit-like protein